MEKEIYTHTKIDFSSYSLGNRLELVDESILIEYMTIFDIKTKEELSAFPTTIGFLSSTQNPNLLSPQHIVDKINKHLSESQSPPFFVEIIDLSLFRFEGEVITQYQPPSFFQKYHIDMDIDC